MSHRLAPPPPDGEPWSLDQSIDAAARALDHYRDVVLPELARCVDACIAADCYDDVLRHLDAYVAGAAFLGYKAALVRIDVHARDADGGARAVLAAFPCDPCALVDVGRFVAEDLPLPLFRLLLRRAFPLPVVRQHAEWEAARLIRLARRNEHLQRMGYT